METTWDSFKGFFDSCKGATTEEMKNAIRTCKFVEAKAAADVTEYQKRLIMQEFRPSHMYPTTMQHDGFRWVCKYAAGAQVLLEVGATGVEAYGMSPEQAMQNFDRLWIGEIAEDPDDVMEDRTGEDI